MSFFFVNRSFWTIALQNHFIVLILLGNGIHRNTYQKEHIIDQNENEPDKSNSSFSILFGHLKILPLNVVRIIRVRNLRFSFKEGVTIVRILRRPTLIKELQNGLMVLSHLVKSIRMPDQICCFHGSKCYKSKLVSLIFFICWSRINNFSYIFFLYLIKVSYQF